MNRFQFAIDSATGEDLPDIKTLARGLIDAIEHTEVEGRDTLGDPAVLIIGSFIAFHVHADVNSALGYQRLLQCCFDNLNSNSSPVMQ